MSRRTGLSAAQAAPLAKLNAAKCHTASASALASSATASEESRLPPTVSSSAVRPSTRSASAPRKAPNRPMGRRRSMVMVATRKAEPVAFQVNSPVTSVSSQRTRKATRPTNHKRRKSGSANSPRRAASAAACRNKRRSLPSIRRMVPGRPARGNGGRPRACHSPRGRSVRERARMSSSDSRPFEGIRVIDCTHVLAGPFAAYQLALLGADVIKVEHPGEPDQSRDSGPDLALNRLGMGTAALTQSSNKRAITLDLKQPTGREVLKKLVADADVL